MEPVLFHAISGGGTNFSRQQIFANNLANINTPGFKADLFQAQAQTFVTGENTGGENKQTFIVQQPNGIDITAGDIIQTGNDLDVAIDGDAWMVVKDTSGKEAYTRNGNLRMNAQGQLTTASGKLVMGSGGPISIPPSRSIAIGQDGTITVTPLEGEPTSLAVLDRLKLVTLDKNNITKNSSGLIELTKGTAKPADSSVKVVQHAIENSNVKAIDQMVAMINSGRDFEYQMNLLSTMNENGQKLSQLLHD